MSPQGVIKIGQRTAQKWMSTFYCLLHGEEEENISIVEECRHPPASNKCQQVQHIHVTKKKGKESL